MRSIVLKYLHLFTEIVFILVVAQLSCFIPSFTASQEFLSIFVGLTALVKWNEVHPLSSPKGGIVLSSVARGGGLAPPIGMSTKM